MFVVFRPRIMRAGRLSRLQGFKDCFLAIDCNVRRALTTGMLLHNMEYGDW